MTVFDLLETFKPTKYNFVDIEQVEQPSFITSFRAKDFREFISLELAKKQVREFTFIEQTLKVKV